MEKHSTNSHSFHNPTEGALKDTWESFIDKMHRTTDVSLAFSTVLKNTQDSNHETSWVAHSQGGIIFCESTRILLKQGMKSQDKNSVIFDAGGNNKSKSDPLMKQAGIKSKYNSAPNDFVHQIAGGNAKNIRQCSRQCYALTKIFFAITESSAHTMAYKGAKQPGLIKQGINSMAIKFWNF